ncbi:hypothetical protein CAPTEDRAFT_202292 [Capitella teleta]|uniref:Uncharacterized protein n=1 Tax=Capitella teleta TaxID=283909 RepID=R7VG25_CAPTE|nr:hypothetical protein CAPTEDRAFT_202292 [Capitella teleta]|eukprot:ELU15241.1 hypothetical protein CAPTEDRAFT_202292 [Capitella teleta]
MEPRFSCQKPTKEPGDKQINQPPGKLTYFPIIGSRLPTSMQVLRCLMYHLREEPSQAAQPSKWDAAKLVYEQVAQFYNKASIPMVPIRKACEKMINLVEENNKLRAIPKNRRQSASTLKKLEDAKKCCQKTLQLWPKDVEHLLNSEDCKFLQSIKTDRKATFGAVDDNLDRKNKRKAIRQEMTAKRLKKLEEEKIASSASTPASPFSRVVSFERLTLFSFSAFIVQLSHAYRRTGNKIKIKINIK